MIPFYYYHLGQIEPDAFVLGDAFDTMPAIASGCANMVFIDPPYFIKKAEWDEFKSQAEYTEFMARTFKQAERILKENGTLAFWHNDLRQIGRFMDWLEENTDFVFNSWALWVKPNFRRKLWACPGPGNSLRSWFNIGEFCLFYVKGHQGTDWNKTGLALAKLDLQKFGPLRGYFQAVQERIGKTKKEIITACGQGADHCFRWNSSQWLLPTRAVYMDLVATYNLTAWPGYRTFDSLTTQQAKLVKEYEVEIQQTDQGRFVHNLDEKHCNIWLSQEATGGHHIHPTQKPVDILERAIKTCTNPGGLVVDFFAGSGSTGVAAAKSGRRFILVEQDQTFRNKGEEWIEKTKATLCI